MQHLTPSPTLRILFVSLILNILPPHSLDSGTVSQTVQTEPSIARRDSAHLSSGLSWQLGILGVLLLWLYWSTLVHLVGQWWHDPNFSHGFFVPLFSAFVVWQERARLSRIAPRPSWSGAGVLLLGLTALVVGRLGAEL